jgi:Flp pilus assembly protein TadG
MFSQKFCLRLSQFISSKRGNVAISFALATIPTLALVGAAVDYSTANSASTAMQAALDSTALMLSKEATTDTDTQLQSNALKYFSAVFNRPLAKNIIVSAAYSKTENSNVIVSATASVPTSFMGIAGYNFVNISGSVTCTPTCPRS